MSALIFESDIDTDKLHRKVNAIDSELNSLARKAANSGSMLDKSFTSASKSAADLERTTINVGNAMQYVGTLVSLSFLASFAKEISAVRGEWQKYEAVLTNTLGSNQDAVESLDMIAKYGAKTNFQVNELTDSYVKLASQGFKPTRDEMASLGDLAASKAKGFNQLTEALIDAETFEFERLKEFGIRAAKNGDEIQFTFKGVKTTVDASAESVRNYILSLGQLDGVKGSTEAISKTIVGLASNFEDAWNQMLNSVGKSQEGLIAGSIKTATELVNNYQSVIDVLEILIASYGAYKAASIALAIVESYRNTSVITQTVKGMYTAVTVTKQLTVAQWASVKAQGALNAIMAINPWIFAATAVSALVTALLVFNDTASEAEKAQKKVNEQVNNGRAKIESLVSQITSENTANADRIRAIKELNGIMPQSNLYLDEQTLKTKEGKQAIDDYIESIKKKAKLEELQSQLQNNFSEQDRVSSGGTPNMSFVKKAAYYSLSNQEQESDRAKALFDLKEEEKQIRANIEAVVAGKDAETDAAKNIKTVSERTIAVKKQLVDAEKKLAEMRKPSSKSTDEDIKKQTDSVSKLKDQLTLLTGIDQEKKKQVKTIDEQIKALEEKVKTQKGEEYQQTIKQIALLEKQRDLQEQMLEMEKKLALNKTITSITTKKANEEIARTLGIDSNKKTPTKITEDFEGEKLHAKAKKITDDLVKSDQKRIELQGQLTDGAYDFTQQLIQQLDLTQEQAEALSGAVDVIANLATGNYIQAGFSALKQMMSGSSGAILSSKLYKDIEIQLKTINNLLEQNQRLIEQSQRYGGQDEAFSEKLKTLQEQQKVVEQQLAVAKSALLRAQSDKNSLFGFLFGKSTAKERQAVADAEKELQSVKDQITDLQTEWDDFLRGGLTENTIADSITQGFEEGKTSVKDFANFVNDMLYNAVISVFKAEILGPEITAMSEYVKAALLDNVLTGDEVDKVNEMSQSIIDKYKPLWDNLTSSLNNGTSSSSTSLTGIASQMTEETGSLVAGQFMAMRVDLKTIQETGISQLEMMDLLLSVLREIASNTKPLSRLEAIENGIKDLNTNIKNLG